MGNKVRSKCHRCVSIRIFIYIFLEILVIVLSGIFTSNIQKHCTSCVLANQRVGFWLESCSEILWVRWVHTFVLRIIAILSFFFVNLPLIIWESSYPSHPFAWFDTENISLRQYIYFIPVCPLYPPLPCARFPVLWVKLVPAVTVPLVWEFLGWAKMACRGRFRLNIGAGMLPATKKLT